MFLMTILIFSGDFISLLMSQGQVQMDSFRMTTPGTLGMSPLTKLNLIVYPSHLKNTASVNGPSLIGTHIETIQMYSLT